MLIIIYSFIMGCRVRAAAAREGNGFIICAVLIECKGDDNNYGLIEWRRVLCRASFGDVPPFSTIRYFI